MKLLHTLTLTLFTLSVSGQTVLPNPSTVTAATINAALTGHITSSTAANDYTGLLTGWTSYPGAFDIRFTNHNTGSATFNLNSIGAKTLKKYSSGSLVDLVSGDISDGEVIRFQYDGTYLIKMGGGSVDVPGSDTQIIRNVSGALGASSSLYYDATNNIFNASSNLTKVGSGSRSNNFYLGIDHTDSVASSTSNGWNFLQGEHETVSNNGSSGSVINNSFFYGGYRNAIRVKSGSASTIYNSGIIGGQDNYISASNSFLGSSVIIGGIKNRITATGVTRKGLAIIGGEKNIVTGNHSVAIGGYSQSVTDSATVAVPNLNITTSPVTADTTTFVLGRRNSDGKVIKIHASALGGGGQILKGGSGIKIVNDSINLGGIQTRNFNLDGSGEYAYCIGCDTTGALNNSQMGAYYAYSSGNFYYLETTNNTNFNILDKSLEFGTSAVNTASCSWCFAGGDKVLSSGSYSLAFGLGFSLGGKELKTSGVASFNFSQNTTAQTANHGALANNSFIGGGQDINIPSTAIGSCVTASNAGKVSASVTYTHHSDNLRIKNNSYFGGFATTPTAKVHIAAGSATASTAPLKLTSGTVLTTPEAGAIEFDGSHFYGTASSTRYQLDQQVGSGPYTAKTATYTATASDYLINCTANSFIVTLPTAVGIAGKMYIIKNTGTATVITIATTSSQTIDGSAPGTITTLTPIRVMSDGANWITF